MVEGKTKESLRNLAVVIEFFLPDCHAHRNLTGISILTS
jgi:hypothetical protein